MVNAVERVLLQGVVVHVAGDGVFRGRGVAALYDARSRRAVRITDIG